VAYTAEIFTSAIVVVGDFNPAIFTPDWLEKTALIGGGDADAARESKSLLVSHQVSNLETKWFALQVTENRLSLTSKDVVSPAFKDLAVGIFQLVPHTPIAAVGMNFLGHYKLAGDDDYHRVGDMLAPKDIWKALYPDEMQGLQVLTIRVQRGTRAEPLKSRDEKRISVQPSERVKCGVFLSYNDHHAVGTSDDESLRPGERVAAIIDGQWESSWQDALRVFDGILSSTLGK
jgi:hypothetical protein